MNFGYVEHGEKRNALVKLSKSALQGYVHLRESVIQRKKEIQSILYFECYRVSPNDNNEFMTNAE